MIQSEAGSPIKWRGKHRAGGEVVANQVASGVRFMVMKVATNDLDLYENGSGLGTDSGLGLLDVTGFTLGSDGPRTGGLVSGLISYAFMYAGDLVADGGYATWSAGIMTYYGIT